MKKNKAPEIRFKGYTDAWEQCKFKDIADFNPKSEIPESFEYVDLESVVGTEMITHRAVNKSNAPSRAQRLAKQGDLFYQTVRPYQKNNYLYDKAYDNYVFSTGYAQIRPKVEGHFLLSYVQTNSFVDEIMSRCTGTSYPAISSSDMENMIISVPKDKDEQIKISKFLMGIDNLITLHQHKYDKLKKLKKSMLNKMFPQGGENVPEVRFGGFTDAWEQCKVEELCSISTGKSNTQDKIAEGKYKFYVRSPIIEHSNRYLYDQEAVLTVGDGVGTGKVFHYVNGKYDLHQRVYRMYDFNGVLGKYFYHIFSIKFYERVMSMTAKTSVDSVRLEMIAKMDLQFPTLEEQTKIVSFLDELDNLITLHQHKLEKMKNIKKSCLEKMFI